MNDQVDPVPPVSPSPANPDATGIDAGGAAAGNESAAAEASGTYVYPDSGAASSQRLRLIPPDGKPPLWWVRHRRWLNLLEAVLTGLFFLLALYFIFLWLFPGPDAAWKVAAKDGRWRQIVVHHTATAAGTPESIDRYHRTVNGWENGLGYHFLIGNGRKDASGAGMGDGEVHVGHRWTRQLDGAHVRMRRAEGEEKANAFSIGIALVGNFDQEDPTARQIASLRRLLGFLSVEYGIPVGMVVGHGAVAIHHTDCPGKRFPLRELIDSL